MKILNLYACLGGNRYKWGDEHEITAVEFDKKTAHVYKQFFPNDSVVVADAHQYLLDHYKEFDFIWSSPPCPTHSKLNTSMSGIDGRKMKYPNMKLYEEIIFLKHWFKGKYVVENVVSYYAPLIEPQKIDRHYFWSNFNITESNVSRPFSMDTANIGDYEKYLGFTLNGFDLDDKRKNLRNCVIPETGKNILDCAMGVIKSENIDQLTMNLT